VISDPVRDLVRLIDQRIALVLPPSPPVELVRGVVQSVIPNLRTAMTTLDGGSVAVPVTYGATDVAAGDQVVVLRRRRDGFLLVGWVLGRDAAAGGGGTASWDIVDALGDLLVGSGPDAVARLGVGTDGQLLYADSTQTLGVKWAAPPVAAPSFSGCRVYRATDFAVATATDTAVTFPSAGSAAFEDYDIGGYHNMATNTTRMVAPVTGTYRLQAHVRFAGGSATGQRQAWFLTSTGLVLARNRENQPDASAGNPTYLPLTSPVALNAGDYVELMVRHTQGTSWNVEADDHATFFAMTLENGAQGPAGVGVPAGGTTGQALTKVDATDYNTQWAALAHAALTGISATDHHAAPAAGPDADVTVDTAGAAGTASTFARSGHGHKVATSATAGAAIGTAAAGTSGTAPARGDHVHPTGAGTPTTAAFGDAAAIGTGPAGAMTDHRHGMPAAPSVPAFATPAIALGTAAGAGAAGTVIRSDATIAAFDATVPVTQAYSDAAAAGTAVVAARRDHRHGMPAAGGGGAPTTADYLVGTADAGLSGEIVVGTTPGGELGGTWAAPTVDAVHSGTAHHAQAHAIGGADHTGTLAHSALSSITATDHHAAPVAGPDADVTIDAAGAAGTASTFARSAHGHKVTTYASAAAVLGTAAAGTSGTAPARGDHVHGHGTGTVANAHAHADLSGITANNHHNQVHTEADHTDSTDYFGISVDKNWTIDGTSSATVLGTALPAQIPCINLPDAATSGCLSQFLVPKDAVAGQPLSISLRWAAVTTDGTSHAVRWSINAYVMVAGAVVDAAGTTTVFTGASAARTAKFAVIEADTQILASVNAGDDVRLNIRRVGADAADTLVSDVRLYKVKVSYTRNH
jgi:hypothetical protein